MKYKIQRLDLIKYNKLRKGLKFSKSHILHFKESINKKFKNNEYCKKIGNNFGNCKGKNNGMYSKKHSEITKIKMSKKGKLRKVDLLQLKRAQRGCKYSFHKHHLDLDKYNNLKENLYYLKNGMHQRFHRLAYHFILEKYGIKEILKYKKWFERNILKKEK